MVDALNARFRDGVPNSDPNLAGVLLHQFDGQEDYDQGWRPCHQHSTNRWCATYADRFASSIINRQAPYVFNDHGGMIFNTIPDDGVALNRILCAYNADAGSMSVTCADGAAAVHEEGGVLRWPYFTSATTADGWSGWKQPLLRHHDTAVEEKPGKGVYFGAGGGDAPAFRPNWLRAGGIVEVNMEEEGLRSSRYQARILELRDEQATRPRA